VVLVAATAGVAACGGNKPPVTTPATPDPFPRPADPAPPVRPPEPPPRPVESPTPPPIPTNTPITADPLAAMSPDDINRTATLKPVFFVYDSDQLDDAARQALNDNAQTLKKYAAWVITVEGHCDERGSAEYNLALGDRRALAARNYLVSLGIAAERVKTVSYGKEFPFDPGHDEPAWAKNRRAQLMVTSKQP
jgi:peptidoglycan-associated lipoprotein